MVEYCGKTQSQRQWDKQMGWRIGTLNNRLKAGWSVERALSTPIIETTKPKCKPGPKPKVTPADNLKDALTIFCESAKSMAERVKQNLPATNASIDKLMAEGKVEQALRSVKEVVTVVEKIYKLVEPKAINETAKITLNFNALPPKPHAKLDGITIIENLPPTYNLPGVCD